MVISTVIPAEARGSSWPSVSSLTAKRKKDVLRQKARKTTASRRRASTSTARIPNWHGWHAARRGLGLGSNLNRMVSDVVTQRILRHSNVSTTLAYYVKGSGKDVQKAMKTHETNIPQDAPGGLGQP